MCKLWVNLRSQLNLAGEHSTLESCWLRHKENLAAEKKLTYEFIKRLKCVERWLKVCKKCSTSFFHTREMKLTWLILHFLAHVKVPTFESICKLFLPKILLKLTTRTFRIDRPGYNQQCKKVKKNAYDKPADYLEFSVWELFKDMQSYRAQLRSTIFSELICFL